MYIFPLLHAISQIIILSMDTRLIPLLCLETFPFFKINTSLGFTIFYLKANALHFFHNLVIVVIASSSMNIFSKHP